VYPEIRHEATKSFFINKNAQKQPRNTTDFAPFLPDFPSFRPIPAPPHPACRQHSRNPQIPTTSWYQMRLMIATAAILLPLIAHPEVIRFDNAAPGTLPAGWSVAMTHAGAAPRWEIVHDDTAPRCQRLDSQAAGHENPLEYTSAKQDVTGFPFNA